MCDYGSYGERRASGKAELWAEDRLKHGSKGGATKRPTEDLEAETKGWAPGRGLQNHTEVGCI